MNMDMEIKVLHMIMKESVTYENESVTFQHMHQHLDPNEFGVYFLSHP